MVWRGWNIEDMIVLVIMSFIKSRIFFLIWKNLILWLSFFQLGIGIDGGESDDNIVLVKKKGKVKALEDEIKTQADSLDLEGTHHVHVGIAHTRWATHGPPSEVSIIWLVCLLSQQIAWNVATTWSCHLTIFLFFWLVLLSSTF